MTLDPIVEEIHQVRAKLFQQYNNDLHAFCEAIRHSQGTTGHAVVSRPPRPAQQGAPADRFASASPRQNGG